MRGDEFDNILLLTTTPFWSSLHLKAIASIKNTKTNAFYQQNEK